jgi:hypothetical protein
VTRTFIAALLALGCHSATPRGVGADDVFRAAQADGIRFPLDPDPQHTTRDYARAVATESLFLARTPDTVYRRRMYDLIRRARLVRTDSLARLYTVLDAVPDSTQWRVRQLILCEAYYQIALYGPAAVERATIRMMDSLNRSGFDANRNEERMARVKGPDMQLPHPLCGRKGQDLPQVPDSLNRVPFPTAFQRE